MLIKQSSYDPQEPPVDPEPPANATGPTPAPAAMRPDVSSAITLPRKNACAIICRIVHTVLCTSLQAARQKQQRHTATGAHNSVPTICSRPPNRYPKAANLHSDANGILQVLKLWMPDKIRHEQKGVRNENKRNSMCTTNRIGQRKESH